MIDVSLVLMTSSTHDKYGLIFELLFKTFAFLTHVMKNIKKKIICDTGSINMRIWVKEAYRFF